MKRFLMILLLVSTLCFCLVSCDGADFDILTGNTDITFKVIDGEAVVTKVPNKSIVTEIVIPDESRVSPSRIITDINYNGDYTFVADTDDSTLFEGE